MIPMVKFTNSVSIIYIVINTINKQTPPMNRCNIFKYNPSEKYNSCSDILVQTPQSEIIVSVTIEGMDDPSGL